MTNYQAVDQRVLQNSYQLLTKDFIRKDMPERKHIIGKLPDGSVGIRIYKTTEEYLETLIRTYGRKRYITRKAARKIAESLDNFYKEIL